MPLKLQFPTIRVTKQVAECKKKTSHTARFQELGLI